MHKFFILLAALITGGIAIVAVGPQTASVAPPQAVHAVSSSGCEHAADGLNDNKGAGFNPNCTFVDGAPVPNCNSDQGFPCRVRPLE